MVNDSRESSLWYRKMNIGHSFIFYPEFHLSECKKKNERIESWRENISSSVFVQHDRRLHCQFENLEPKKKKNHHTHLPTPLYIYKYDYWNFFLFSFSIRFSLFQVSKIETWHSILWLLIFFFRLLILFSNKWKAWIWKQASWAIIYAFISFWFILYSVIGINIIFSFSENCKKIK